MWPIHIYEEGIGKRVKFSEASSLKSMRTLLWIMGTGKQPIPSRSNVGILSSVLLYSVVALV